MPNSKKPASGGTGTATATAKSPEIEVNRAIGTGGVVAARKTADYQLAERAVMPLGIVEAEAGGAAKFSDHGGPVLANARVQLVFWGNAWSSVPAPSPSATQISNAVGTIVASPYLSAASQYRKTIGQASLRGVTMATGTNPPNPFSDQNVVDMLRGLLDAGTLPNPLTETVLYMVVVPNGVNNTGSGFIGEHSFFNYNAHIGFVTLPVPVHFAWVTNNGSLDGVTTILSHELVESVTDPEGSAVTGNAGVCNQGGWCEVGDVCNTAGRVNGVMVQSYWSDLDGACIIPDGMVAGPVAANPGFIQSRFGTKGNFEVVVARPNGGLAHYWRNDDDPFLAWHGPYPFGSGLTNGVSLIESHYGTPGNLELMTVSGGQLKFYWRDSGPAFAWNGPFTIGSGVAGIPSLIQSRFGAKGNFELVVPSATSGLNHYWRNNDVGSLPWSGATNFGASLGHVDAVSIIQSNYGNPGNLEVMCVAAGSIYFFWRDSGPAFSWNGPFHIASGVSGDVALIQSRFGTKGNFEMVAPLAGGGVGHWWRNNDNPSMPWSAPTTFGSGHVDEVSLIESNFGSPGNLEVVVRIGSRLALFWRDSGPAFHWNGPSFITR